MATIENIRQQIFLKKGILDYSRLKNLFKIEKNGIKKKKNSKDDETE